MRSSNYVSSAFAIGILKICSGTAQFVERSTLMRKYPGSIPGEGEKNSIFYWEYFWAISTQMCIEHDLPMNGWATSKLCQVTRLPMCACQWSEDENWEWTTIL